jgi:hypothetical protein
VSEPGQDLPDTCVVINVCGVKAQPGTLARIARRMAGAYWLPEQAGDSVMAAKAILREQEFPREPLPLPGRSGKVKTGRLTADRGLRHQHQHVWHPILLCVHRPGVMDGTVRESLGDSRG